MEKLVQCLPDANWWDLVPAIVGAFVGAAAAAIPAYLLARKSSKEMLERDRISRAEQQKAATLRALVKLQTIVNVISGLHHELEGMISKADAEDHNDLALWAKVTPIVGVSDVPIRFEAEEISIFLGKESDYLNELFLLAVRYNSTITSLNAYSDKRERLTEQFSAQVRGKMGTTFMSEDEKAKFAPRIKAINDLLSQLRDNLASDYKMALLIAEKFGQKVRAQLNDATFPRLLNTENPDHTPTM